MLETRLKPETIPGNYSTGTRYKMKNGAIARQAGIMMSTKSVKTKMRGTSINEKDADEIIAGVQAMYDKIPGFVRPMLPALPDILRRIPASAGKYTLNEIIELLDSAYESGRLKR